MGYSEHDLGENHDIGDYDTGKRVHWGYHIVGILFIITAVLAFLNPFGNLEALAFAFAVMAVLYGIWQIVNRQESGLRVLAGMFDILIGAFLIFNYYWAVVALPYIFATWFIVDSLLRLFTIGYARAYGTGYFWFSLIVNILGVILGIMMLFDPITAALTIGFMVGLYLLVAGVECIAYAFYRPERAR